MSVRHEPISLIVNADDYGYFSSVSAGIREAIRAGCVTATGVMANCDYLDSQVSALLANKDIDIGIHLNLTYGYPLSEDMRNALALWGGRFPGIFRMALALTAGKIDAGVVKNELIAQIETCQRKGIDLLFINSHEHIHMLPALYKMSLSLAEEYRIPFVRYTSSEWLDIPDVGAIARNVVFHALNLLNSGREPEHYIRLLGLSRSGNLSYSYLRKLFGKLQPGKIYELMCHPGCFDPTEIKDKRLTNYHGWGSELKLLTSSRIRDLFAEFHIEVARYRDILSRNA
jgi:predicted glycoside hydrolase/deacetylase ChbG (UPF0249 family)